MELLSTSLGSVLFHTEMCSSLLHWHSSCWRWSFIQLWICIEVALESISKITQESTHSIVLPTSDTPQYNARPSHSSWANLFFSVHTETWLKLCLKGLVWIHMDQQQEMHASSMRPYIITKDVILSSTMSILKNLSTLHAKAIIIVLLMFPQTINWILRYLTIKFNQNWQLWLIVKRSRNVQTKGLRYSFSINVKSMTLKKEESMTNSHLSPSMSCLHVSFLQWWFITSQRQVEWTRKSTTTMLSQLLISPLRWKSLMKCIRAISKTSMMHLVKTKLKNQEISIHLPSIWRSTLRKTLKSCLMRFINIS